MLHTHTHTISRFWIGPQVAFSDHFKIQTGFQNITDNLGVSIRTLDQYWKAVGMNHWGLKKVTNFNDNCYLEKITKSTPSILRSASPEP